MVKNILKAGKARNITSIHTESVVLTAYPLLNRHGVQVGVFHGCIANKEQDFTISFYYGDYSAGEVSLFYFDVNGEEFFNELCDAKGDLNRVLSLVADHIMSSKAK